MIAPCSCAHAASFSTGLIVPSVFETRLFATTLTLPRDGDLVERVELQLAEVVDRDVRELGAGLLGDELPRDEVRVVLELGDHDDVAGAEVLEAPRVRDEVQRLGRAAREDHLAVRRRVDVGAHLLARALVAGGRALGERVDAAMHVRVECS